MKLYGDRSMENNTLGGASVEKSLPARSRDTRREIEVFAAYLAVIDFIYHEMPNVKTLGELRTPLRYHGIMQNWARLVLAESFKLSPAQWGCAA